MIKTKSVYSSIKTDDGLRILVTRFRGRGLKKTRYNVWMANLGPSEKILKKYQADKISWTEFKNQYKSELFGSDKSEDENKTIKNHGQKFTLRLLKTLSKRQDITLMCHCDENQSDCHVNVLREVLEENV